MKQHPLFAPLVVWLIGCPGGSQTPSSGGAGAMTNTTSTSSQQTTTGSAMSGSTGSAGPTCPACSGPTEIGELGPAKWNEISGIIASKDHPGMYYLHNDSGDSARFFAMDATGADQGTFAVTNATAVDWEDIARGPCAMPSQGASESCIYLGDFGDNRSQRSDYKLYRVKEPATLGVGDHDVTAETIPFSYPDGSHNAECLLANPATGEMVIVTKSIVGSTVYRFPTPLAAGVPVTLEKVVDIVYPDLAQLVTGCDVNPAGTWAILRTYGYAYGYPIAAGESLGAALAKEPCSLPVAGESQGEALGFSIDGSGFLTVSEGSKSPISQVLCTP